MSLKTGNRYTKEGKINEAIAEYRKITPDSPLYQSAQFNINKLQSKNYNPIVKRPHIIMNEPLVSVVMPVFNVAPYLDASILSVLNQSYGNLEVIIVNDASTDNGLSIINMFADLDKRIRVINLEFNTLGGAGIPSNIGVDNATGEFIAYADSDDILDKDAVAKMVELALKENVEVVVADFSNFSDDTRKVDVSYDKKNWKELPLDKSFCPDQFPDIFKLSPVPWRKLYKKSFLDKYNIRFPEGDYFYEDNPLHWFVLSQAKRVALLDYVVAYHRMGREGQTMGANNYKLSAQYCHLNTVKNFLEKNGVNSKIYWKELIDFSYRSGWVIDRQESEEICNIVKKRYVQVSRKIVDSSNVHPDEIKKLRGTFFEKIEKFDSLYEDKDLTIIIPVYNCADLLEVTLESLSKLNLKIEIFMVDDGSTDNSKIICEKYVSKHKDFHVFTQNNKGAGVARNTVIPLATGRYTFFLDADDTVDTRRLEEAVKYATSNDNDLTIFRYRIHFFETNSYRDMWDADQEVFKKLLKSNSQIEKQILSSKLVNYPWNRVIKTSLLHDANIFFGKTVVHNDIPYHWHSIVASKNLGIFDKAICNHRKFEKREQITNITDHRRMMVLEAYRYTDSIIKQYENYNDILPQWKKFIAHILEWAEEKIPAELKDTYKSKKVSILQELKERK